MDTGSEQHGTKHSDISTFKATLDTVIRAHYPAILGHIAIRVVPIPAMCAETLQLLARCRNFPLFQVIPAFLI